MSDWFQRFGFADVADDLLIGAYPTDADDVDLLARVGVQEVVNLCEDVEYADGEREVVVERLAAQGIPERRVPLLDHGELPEDELDAAVTTVVSGLEAGRRVYLHCRAGWQRSAAVAAGALAVHEGIGLEQALAQLRERKSHAEPLPHQTVDLFVWWRRRG